MMMSADTNVDANPDVRPLSTQDLEAVSGGLKGDIKPLSGATPFDNVITLNSTWATLLIDKWIY
jgi:hypothetical protein